MNLNKEHGVYYILVSNFSDFLSIQSELFEKGCKWNNGSTELWPKIEHLKNWLEQTPFPMYIIIVKFMQSNYWEMTLNSIENTSKYGGFDKSNIVNSSLLLRKQKIKKLYNVNKE